MKVSALDRFVSRVLILDLSCCIVVAIVLV